MFIHFLWTSCNAIADKVLFTVFITIRICFFKLLFKDKHSSVCCPSFCVFLDTRRWNKNKIWSDFMLGFFPKWKLLPCWELISKSLVAKSIIKSIPKIPIPSQHLPCLSYSKYFKPSKKWEERKLIPCLETLFSFWSKDQLLSDSIILRPTVLGVW